jgi:hypothetical protein
MSAVGGNVMPTYTELKQRAHLLPLKLSRVYERQYTLGGIFCSCFTPVIGGEVITDALLIQQTVTCLEFYSEGDDIKLLVLTGMYIYIWQRYGSTLQHLINKPFLDLLAEHLETTSLVDLDNVFYKASLDELDNFCNWVYSNRKFTELELLYNSFPADMRANIHIQKTQQPVGETSFSKIANYMENIRENGLF